MGKKVSSSKAVKKPESFKEKLGFSAEEYNLISKEAILVNILLRNSEFDVKEVFHEVPKEKHKYSYGHDWLAIKYIPSSGVIGGTVQWSIDVNIGRKKGLKIKAKYIILYEGLEDCNPKAVEAFVQRVGRVAVYPYFRSLVSQLGWSAGIDLPILPVLSANPFNDRD